MSSYKFDSIVNRQEAEALKELIFKRARERAEGMTKETQEAYTSSIRNDIMDLARNSFSAERNPFAAKQDSQSKPEAAAEEHDNKNEEIGFPERHIDEIKSRIVYKNKVQQEETVHAEIEETMADARAGFNKKTSFMGALNFLNSQASISLVNKKGKKFEALA